jgi:Fe-Mn family superoxide dismutase
MRYAIAPIGCRPWLLNGLSDRLIVSHYENNYGGAVRRLNTITERLASLDFATVPEFQVAGLKRDELVALNSMALHELYFASLGGDGKSTERMASAMKESFGSVDRWRDEFTAMARALSGGSGWVLLVYLPRERRLVNQYALDHTQNLATGTPILALDMYEHAYHIDFGANAAAYIDATMRNVDWARVELRYLSSTGEGERGAGMAAQQTDLPFVSVEAIRDRMAGGETLRVIDVRPAKYHQLEKSTMAGATWRDPERVGEWSRELSKSEPVLVYCVYGFHVGCGVTAALRKEGFDARYVAGGLSAWKAIGGKRTSGDATA